MENLALSCSNGLIILDTSQRKLLEKSRHGDSLASAFAFSLNGEKYACSFGTSVKVYSATTNKELFDFPYERVNKCTFSPDASILVIHRNLKHDTPEPNLRFIDLSTGNCLKEVVQSKSQLWKPQWTRDSSICARYTQDEVHIYQNNKFNQPPSGKISAKGLAGFALGQRGPNPNIAVFIIGQKGQPNLVCIHNISDGQAGGVTMRKSFYKADDVQMLWSDRGTDLLVLASTSRSEKSYYGEQTLHFLTTHKGGETATVQIAGAILDVKWLPTLLPPAQEDKATASATKNSRAAKAGPSPGPMFAVCHGSLPTKVTIFGTDCEPKFDLGTGPWNTLLCNPIGNLILVGGFGNISGNGTIWDLTKKQKICSLRLEDATHVAWSECGQHFVAATCTPRLRVNNGFKVYRYTGELVAQWEVEKRAVPKPATEDLPAQIYHELHHVILRPLDEAHKPTCSFIPEKGSIDAQVTGIAKSNAASRANAYVPPSLRNVRDNPISGRKTGPVGGIQGAGESGKKSSQNQAPDAKVKQIGAIKTKLKQIEKLKQERSNGKQLDQAQIAKIDSEQSLLEQLTGLQLAQ